MLRLTTLFTVQEKMTDHNQQHHRDRKTMMFNKLLRAILHLTIVLSVTGHRTVSSVEVKHFRK